MEGAIIDNPEQVAAEMRDFRQDRNAPLLGRAKNDRPVYPHQWVALYAGEVKAHADTYESRSSTKLTGRTSPRGRTIIRYIDPNPRTLIL